MAGAKIKLADYYGANLANLLADKIIAVHPKFDAKGFVTMVKTNCVDKSLTERKELIADSLCLYLPTNYQKAIAILLKIMGVENLEQTGMYKNFYWLMPVAKFVEKYGTDDLDTSLMAIEELTKRCTGEYAIRPFIQKYPKQTLQRAKLWAKSENFHLRRLASEGLRPKLPWAKKLDLFIDNPKPVFQILNLLKTESTRLVKTSVANNIADYLKVNPVPALELIEQWKKLNNTNTAWMIKHATRKIAD